MPRIFISYRRSDSADIAGRIYDRLAARVGEKNVFKDVDKIPLGTDFRAVIETELINCDIMLVIIGPDWLNAADSAGNRRLDNPDDFVRVEIELGLRHSNVTVIPVLVNGAHMPHETDLPSHMDNLAFLNAATIRNDPDFERDTQRLIRAIAPRRVAPWIGVLAGILVVVALVVVGVVLSNNANPTQPPPTQAVSNPTQPPTQAVSNLTATHGLIVSPTPSGAPVMPFPTAIMTIPMFNTATPIATEPMPSKTFTASPTLIPTDTDTLLPKATPTHVSTLSFPATPTAFFATQCVITNLTTDRGIFIRREPNINSAIIDLLKQGEALGAAAQTQDKQWYLVGTAYRQGWVAVSGLGSPESSAFTAYCKYLPFLEAPEISNMSAQCSVISSTTFLINVRAEPNINGDSIDLLNSGQVVFPTGITTTGWFRINFAQRTGWIYGGVMLYSDPCNDLPRIPP